MATRNEIVGLINAHMALFGGAFSTWYVGISAFPSYRLFTAHKVNEDVAQHIILQADSSEVAREVECAYVDAGTGGGPGGGDETAVWVYAYKITDYTDEKA